MKWAVSILVALIAILAAMGFLYCVVNYPQIMVPIGMGLWALSGIGAVAFLVVAIKAAIFD